MKTYFSIDTLWKEMAHHNPYFQLERLTWRTMLGEDDQEIIDMYRERFHEALRIAPPAEIGSVKWNPFADFLKWGGQGPILDISGAFTNPLSLMRDEVYLKSWYLAN